MVVSETKLSLKELYANFHQNSQTAAEILCQCLRTEGSVTLSPHAMKMIFGFEVMGRAGGIAPKTVREKGNAAAHELDCEFVIMSFTRFCKRTSRKFSGLRLRRSILLSMDALPFLPQVTVVK